MICVLILCLMIRERQGVTVLNDAFFSLLFFFFYFLVEGIWVYDYSVS